MNSAQPPKMATWLLKQFGCSPNNDAVIGDLIEQYHQGQTSYWYWKQTFVAIVRSMFREVGDQKWRTLSAVAVGWMMLTVFDFISRVGVIGHPYTLRTHPEWMYIVPILNLLVTLVTGWTVARICGARHSAAVLLFAGSFLFYSVITRLTKLLLIYPHLGDMDRTTLLVSFLVISPLETLLLALLILKGGGLLSTSPAPRRSDV